MSDGVRSHRFGPALLAALLTAAGPVQAQIVTDGSVGRKVTLNGGQIEIGAELGARRGANLFHSFEKFGIATGQTATFTGPGEIKNVISRVTGGEISSIDGTLASTVGQADLYFLNPAGIVFGPNATLDVPGSFHVSTAHELRFADGTRFSALDKTGSGLTIAAPEAFGFLDRAPGRIGIEQSQLKVPTGKTVSLVGGDLDITGTQINGIPDNSVTVENGTVNLVSITGAGQFRFSNAAVEAAQQGAIRVADQALIDVSGNGGGTIRIRGGTLEVQNSAMFADNTGERNSTTGFDLQAGSIEISNSWVTADVFDSGRGGTIKVKAGQLAIWNRGRETVIGNKTYGPADAGTVSVRADRLFISGDGARDYDFTGIRSESGLGSSERGLNPEGSAGRVEVTAGDLEIRKNGAISTATQSIGNAGTVSVQAGHLLISRDGGPYFTGIGSHSWETAKGDAGQVEVTAGDLEIYNGGAISTDTYSIGSAGMTSVRADHLFISGEGARNYNDFTGIRSEIMPDAKGKGGRVEVTAGDLEIRKNGAISTATHSTGNAGTVSVQAGHLLISRDGEPYFTGIGSQTWETAKGDAGQVEVAGGDLEIRNGGAISTDTYSMGNAGTVLVQADHRLISGNGSPYSAGINSDNDFGSTGGAGIVRATAGGLQLLNGGQISSNTYASGNAGTVQVQADQLLISGASTSISSLTDLTSIGAGGAVTVGAQTMQVRDGGTVSTQSKGSGVGGSITINVTDIALDHAAIQSRTAIADGGSIKLAVGHLFDLRNSSVTTSVAEGNGSGGDILINSPLMVFDNSQIIANAQGGSGGNINIRAGQLIRTPDSVIQASSAQSVSGNITINAPNTDVAGSLVVLPETFFDVSSQLREACAARGGRPASSFTAGGRGSLPPDPGAPLAASSSGQSQERQNATGSSTVFKPRPSQAAEPVIAAGTPQPVLGSPRLTCRGWQAVS